MNRPVRCYVFAVLLWPGLVWASAFDEGLRLKREQKLPEAEQQFAQWLEQNPQDLAGLMELATVQGWQDRHEDAAASWRRAVAVAPAAAEPRIGLARVLYWSQKREEALTELDRVLANDPRNYDALLLRGDVLIAAGDRRGARDSYVRAQGLPPGNDDRELAALISRSAEPALWRIDSGHAFEDYSNERGSESGSYLQLGYRVSDSTSAYVRWDRLEQFASVDNQILAGAYWLPTPRWLLWLEAGGTNSPDFRPGEQAQLVVEWLSTRYAQPLLGYRYFSYDNGEVHTLTPGLRLLTPGPGDVEWRYALSRNIDESETAVASLRYGLSLGRFTPYIAYYDGEEALPPQPEAEFTTLAVGSGLRLSSRWSVRADYAYEDRKRFYRHHTLALGLTCQF